jgi:hypothetical protein
MAYDHVKVRYAQIAYYYVATDTHELSDSIRLRTKARWTTMVLSQDTPPVDNHIQGNLSSAQVGRKEDYKN